MNTWFVFYTHLYTKYIISASIQSGKTKATVEPCDHKLLLIWMSYFFCYKPLRYDLLLLYCAIQISSFFSVEYRDDL